MYQTRLPKGSPPTTPYIKGEIPLYHRSRKNPLIPQPGSKLLKSRSKSYRVGLSTKEPKGSSPKFVLDPHMAFASRRVAGMFLSRIQPLRKERKTTTKTTLNAGQRQKAFEGTQGAWGSGNLWGLKPSCNQRPGSVGKELDVFGFTGHEGGVGWGFCSRRHSDTPCPELHN